MMKLKRELWVGAAAAAAAFLVVACGGGGSGCASDADCTSGQVCNTTTKVCGAKSCATNADCTGNLVCGAAKTCVAPDPTCTTDASCGEGKMCHPTLKLCVASCLDNNGCPASAKTCATAAGTVPVADGGVKGFCHCSTTELCNGGTTGALICQDTTSLICTAKCTTAADCGAGAVCNAGTGKCAPGGSDAGVDAGAVDAGFDAGTVDAGPECDHTNEEPDLCGYGYVCSSIDTCYDVTDGYIAGGPACSNLTNAKDPVNPSNPRTGFSESSSTGPVIYNLIDEATDDTGACGGGATDNPYTFTVYAYAGLNDTFPATRSALNGFYLFRSNGTSVDLKNNFLAGDPNRYVLSPDSKNLSMRVTLCPGSSVGTNYTIGVGFTNGNLVCSDLTK